MPVSQCQFPCLRSHCIQTLTKSACLCLVALLYTDKCVLTCLFWFALTNIGWDQHHFEHMKYSNGTKFIVPKVLNAGN